MKEISFRNDVLPLKDKLFRLALRITLNREDAEDIVQETLIRVWKECQEGKEIDNVEAFSLTICRNLSLDHNAKLEQRNVAFDEDVHDQPDTTRSPFEEMVDHERFQMLNALMLSDAQRLDEFPAREATHCHAAARCGRQKLQGNS